MLSRVQLFATLWTVARQAPLSMGFSRQEYWSGLPFPSPGDLPNPGIEPGSPAWQADALSSEPSGNTEEEVPNIFKLFLPSATTFAKLKEMAQGQRGTLAQSCLSLSFELHSAVLSSH